MVGILLLQLFIFFCSHTQLQASSFYPRFESEIEAQLASSASEIKYGKDVSSDCCENTEEQNENGLPAQIENLEQIPGNPLLKYVEDNRDFLEKIREFQSEDDPFLLSQYRNLDDLYSYMQTVAANPGKAKVTLEVIGKSIEGRDIYCLRVEGTAKLPLANRKKR